MSRQFDARLASSALTEWLSISLTCTSYIHDGQEHKRSMQGPDTDAQDQPPPFIQIRLAPPGQSIHLGHSRHFEGLAITSGRPFDGLPITSGRP
jgi:hypothetical protein